MVETIKGIVLNIQRAALHDGPGLRTVVFLKGCPLHCLWCHNPESQNPRIETGRSGKVYGRMMTIEEVMQIVRADLAYYQSSGGGLTVSGGEPTAQFDFCKALLLQAKHKDIKTCLDTCGEFPNYRLRELLEIVDLWHYDYKATIMSP
jgi:pyruvate formate lyase activating enzyme